MLHTIHAILSVTLNKFAKKKKGMTQVHPCELEIGKTVWPALSNFSHCIPPPYYFQLLTKKKAKEPM